MPTSDDRFDALERLVMAGFEKVDWRFERLEQKFERLEQKFEGLEQKFEGLEQKFEGLKHGFNDMRADFGGRIDILANYVRMTDQGYFKMTNQMSDLELRVARLEKAQSLNQPSA